MEADLDTFSLPELEELLVRIRAEIEIREREPAPRPILRTRAGRAAAEQISAAIEASTPPPATSVPAEAGVPAEPSPEIAAPPEAEAPVEPPTGQPAEPASEPATPPAPPDEPEAEVIKYMHPSNRQLTWSGEGAKPAWVEIWLYTGGTLYALEVAAEKLRPRPKPSFALPPSPPLGEEAQPQARRRRPRRGRHTS